MQPIPTTVIAVRHGETEWNKVGRQQGHLDSPLTPLGKEQARAMAEGLRGFVFDACYASDLERARETAAIIAYALGLAVRTDPRLRERHLGILQGLTYEELDVKHPRELERFLGDDPDYRIPGGESVRDRYERHTAGLIDLARSHPGQTILIVAHGGTLRSFMDRALSIPLGTPRAYSLPNAAVNVFSISATGEWRLETWAETAHLRRDGLSSLDDT